MAFWTQATSSLARNYRQSRVGFPRDRDMQPSSAHQFVNLVHGMLGRRPVGIPGFILLQSVNFSKAWELEKQPSTTAAQLQTVWGMQTGRGPVHLRVFWIGPIKDGTGC